MASWQHFATHSQLIGPDAVVPGLRVSLIGDGGDDSDDDTRRRPLAMVMMTSNGSTQMTIAAMTLDDDVPRRRWRCTQAACAMTLGSEIPS